VERRGVTYSPFLEVEERKERCVKVTVSDSDLQIQLRQRTPGGTVALVLGGTLDPWENNIFRDIGDLC
jgi:hypothetical protein